MTPLKNVKSAYILENPYQFLPIKAIYGLYDALKAVSDIGHIGQPLHVHGDILQGHEES